MTLVPVARANVGVVDSDLLDGSPRTWSDIEQTSGLGRLPELAFAMAIGSAVIAIAFAASRYDRPWAGHLYWLGEVIIYASPAAFLLLRKKTYAIEAVGIAMLMPVTTFLINQYYSPGQFRFLDEFEHVQTRPVNPGHPPPLPRQYNSPAEPPVPGARDHYHEHRVDHASLNHDCRTNRGRLTHVMVAIVLYFLIVEVCARPRVAALAVVLYATGSHYQFFDSYFIYETIALPFLLLALLATVKMMKSRGLAVIGWGSAAVACGAVTAMCHHVTSYALVGLLLAFVIAQLFVPSSAPQQEVYLVVFFAVSAIVGIWDLGVATTTVSATSGRLINGLIPVTWLRLVGAPQTGCCSGHTANRHIGRIRRIRHPSRTNPDRGVEDVALPSL